MIVGPRAQHGGGHVELVGQPASAVHARIRCRPLARQRHHPRGRSATDRQRPAAHGRHPDVDQPGLYFGENLEGYAIVKTQQREIDFPQENGTNQTSTYRGTGGVEMNSVFKRAALALRFGDYNAFISGFITDKSRALYVRDIQRRVRKVAPFLRYDNDPYPVLIRIRAARTGSSGCRTPTRHQPLSLRRTCVDRPATDGERVEHLVQLRAQLGEGRHRCLQRLDEVLRRRHQGPAS